MLRAVLLALFLFPIGCGVTPIDSTSQREGNKVTHDAGGPVDAGGCGGPHDGFLVDIGGQPFDGGGYPVDIGGQPFDGGQSPTDFGHTDLAHF
ncbi:MAG: hypothetical protein JWN44_1498 [Myxococcales bacterium]|nr:hypothetical protein [Myxococcales bacterium]